MNRSFLKSLAMMLILFTLASCTVPAPTEENTIVIEGELTQITTCCEGGDVQFYLEGYESGFYINRAIEAGFDLEAFEAEVLIGTTVYIRAFDRFLPNDPSASTISGLIPSAEIATAEKVFFSTLDKE